MRGLTMILVAGLLAGCATAQAPRRPPVDVAGRWAGTWSSSGVALVPRDEDVTLDLVQGGATGTGRLVMGGTLAADSVPDPVRDSGLTGVRVLFDVSGNHLRVWHELGDELFAAELLVLGDHMIGSVLGTDPPVRFDLTRERPRVASVPLVAAPPTAERPPVPEPAPVTEAPPTPPVAEAPEPAAPPSPSRREAPPPAEFSPIDQVRTIHFDFDRSDIRPAEAAILDANAEWLRANPERLVLIEGHCDERGTAEYNLALGERRALATKAYLVGRGIAESRLTITSYGFERPVCTEHNEACWARNRRAAFFIK